jgi:hypothetical protein
MDCAQDLVIHISQLFALTYRTISRQVGFGTPLASYICVKKFNPSWGETTMAITKKSLIGNSSSKKSTKKSTTKASGPVAAAKLATASRQVVGMKASFRASFRPV